LPLEVETLSVTDQYNEQVMTGLRTIWGISLVEIENNFGIIYKNYLLEQSQKHINEDLLYIDEGKIMVTNKGMFLSDGIASDLFKVNIN